MDWSVSFAYSSNRTRPKEIKGKELLNLQHHLTDFQVCVLIWHSHAILLYIGNTTYSVRSSNIIIVKNKNKNIEQIIAFYGSLLTDYILRRVSLELWTTSLHFTSCISSFFECSLNFFLILLNVMVC